MIESQEDWQDIPLGDERYFQLATGGTPSTERKEYWENGTIPWLSSGEVHKKLIRFADGRITEKGFQNSNARFYPAHSILIALAGQGKTRGTAAITEVEATSNQSIAAIIPNKGLVEPYFVYYYLDSLYQELRSISAGAGRAGLSLSILADVSIKLPDKPTQERIAAVLSCIDHVIEQTEVLIAKQQRIKTGLMQDLLTKGIDGHGNIRSEATHEFKDSPLGRIPKEWEVECLGNIFNIKSGATPLRKKKERYYYEGSIRWVKTLDLNEGYITQTSEKITDLAVAESSCSIFPTGSVLIAMYGGWEQIGRTGVLASACATNQAISALYSPNRAIVPEYVQLFLQQFRHKWKEFAASTRKDPNITRDDICSFRITLPRHAKEQSNITESILAVKQQIEKTRNEYFKLLRVKAGLMQDLLTGKVSVENLLAGREAAEGALP